MEKFFGKADSSLPTWRNVSNPGLQNLFLKYAKPEKKIQKLATGFFSPLAQLCEFFFSTREKTADYTISIGCITALIF